MGEAPHGVSLAGSGLTATHLGTWTNLLGGWELDKVLDDRWESPIFFPPFFVPSTENPNPCMEIWYIST